MNEKKIVIDYDEYLDLRETAEINDEKFKNKVLKTVNKIEKDIRHSYEIAKSIEKDEIEEKIKQSLKDRFNKSKNIFGYVKYKEIEEIMFDVFEERPILKEGVKDECN